MIINPECLISVETSFDQELSKARLDLVPVCSVSVVCSRSICCREGHRHSYNVSCVCFRLAAHGGAREHWILGDSSLFLQGLFALVYRLPASVTDTFPFFWKQQHVAKVNCPFTVNMLSVIVHKTYYTSDYIQSLNI